MHGRKNARNRNKRCYIDSIDDKRIFLLDNATASSRFSRDVEGGAMPKEERDVGNLLIEIALVIMLMTIIILGTCLDRSKRKNMILLETQTESQLWDVRELFRKHGDAVWARITPDGRIVVVDREGNVIREELTSRGDKE